MTVNQMAGIESVQVTEPIYQLTKISLEKSKEHFDLMQQLGL